MWFFRCESVWLGWSGGSGWCVGQVDDQSCVNLGDVSVFWLWWCGQSGGGWTGGLEKGICGEVNDLESLCRWQVQVSVHCASLIPVHLKCTQCLLHLIDVLLFSMYFF